MPDPLLPTDVRNDAREDFVTELLHDFDPDESKLTCLACGLPLDNRRHRTESRLNHLIQRKIEQINEDVRDLQSLNDQLTYVMLRQQDIERKP